MKINQLLPEYSVWQCIKQYCYNTKHECYKNFGAKGIVLCNEWKEDFWQFFHDVGVKPSLYHQLRRINDDGNFCKDNVQWVNTKVTYGNHMPEYRAWQYIKQLCYNPNHSSYKNYGGKGVTMCSEWNGFLQFYEDVGPRPSPKHKICRTDDDGNFCKNNVQWATNDEVLNGRIRFAKRLPEYKVWQCMKARCFDPNSQGYKNYGSRGITVCDEWKNDFWRFYEDVGARPTPEHQIDRIDNDGNYCKDNVRWATRKENLNNKRTNRLLTIDGETRTMAQWIESSGLSESAFKKRMKKGWSLHDIISTPPNPRYQRLK